MNVPKMSEPWVRASLVMKMTCVAAAALAILLGVVLAGSYRYWREFLREQIHTRLSIAAATRQKTVQTQIALLRQRATLTADRGSLRGFILEHGEHADTPQRAWSQTFLDRTCDGKPIVSARLADLTGRVLLATDPAEIDHDMSKDPVFQGGLSASGIGRPGWVGTHLEAEISAPIRRFTGNVSQDTIGVLILTADLTPLVEALNDKTGLGTSGEVLLVVSEGGQIPIPIPGQRRERTALPDATVVAIANVASGKDPSLNSYDYGGKPVLAVGRPIGYDGWGVVAKIDTSEAYAPIADALKLELILGGGVAAIGLVVAYGMARSFTQPIHQLTEAARMVTGGDLTTRVPVGSLDELGCLSAEFNEMTARLESSIAAASIELAERERAESALRQSEARFARAFQSNPGAMCITTTKDGRFIEVNERYCQLFDHTREELIGRTALDLALWANPVERALLVERLQACGFIRDHATHFRRKKGDLIHAVISMELIDFPGEREPVIVSMFADITERKRAEDVAVLLAAIVDSSFDAIVGKDLNGVVTSWNAGAERMFGYTAGEMIGHSITRLIPPDRRDEEEGILARTRRGESVEHFETVRVKKDGGLIDVSVTVSPIRNSSGEIIGASKVARDVTDQKRAAQALRESEERLHAVTENLTEGLIVSDLDGQLLHWNRAGLEMHGFRNLEEGLRMMPEFAEIFDLRTLDGISMSVDQWPLARVLRGERLRDAEVRIHRRGRDWYRVFNYSGNIVHDASGQPLAFVAMSDITERKQAEEALRVREEQLLLYAEHSPVAIAMFDRDMKYLVLSHRWREDFRLGDQSLIGRCHYEVFPEISQNWIEIHQRCLAGAVEKCDEEAFPRGDGTTDWIRWEVRPWRQADGTIGGIIVFCEYITERKEAEDKLQASEERLRIVTDNSRVGLVMVNRERRYTFANAAYADILGLPSPDIVDQRVADVLAPIYEEQIRPRLDRAFAGERISYELQKPADGRNRYFAVRYEPTKVDGEVALVVVVITDISERKLAEDELASSQAQLQAIFDNITEGICVIDPEHDVVNMNPACQRVVGLSEPGLSRTDTIPLVEILLPNGEIVPQENWPGHRALRGDFVQNYELVIRQKVSGRASSLEYNTAPIRDKTGKARQVIVSFRDVTERRQTEARYRTLFDYAPDGILIADPRSYYLDANASICRMLGYARDELVGLNASDIVVPSEIPHIGEALSVIGSKSEYQREWQFRRKDGSVFAAEVIATMMPDGNLLGMVRDITERKRADATLREVEKEKQLAFEASRLKSEFLANMSHELRTPLNCIIGFTEFLVDEKPGALNSKQKEYLTDVYTSSKHLLQLINDVLDLAKVEAGKIELHLESFPLAKAIEEVCAVVKGIAQKKGVSVTYRVAPEVSNVTLDQQKFKQVCYNLMSNAVKFTDPGGSVEITALAREGGRFQVRVADTGIGIKKEDLHRLFREFEQLESGSDRRFEGTGLGLALTKKLVESHGGSIGVESEYGSGSTFFAVLPTVVAEVKEHE